MSLKKLAIGVLALVSLAACSASDSSQDAANSDLYEQIVDSGTIRVGTEGDYPPYAYHDEQGKLVGIEVEIMELLADDMGVDVAWTPAPWDSLIAGVDADKYDVVIDSLAVTKERQAKYDFTAPYTRSVGKFAVADSSNLVSIKDLGSDVKSAQTPTSNWGMMAADDFDLDIVTSDGLTASLELVTSGRADTTLNDVVSFKLYQDEHPDAPIKLLDGDVEAPDCCSILVRKGENTLVDALNEHIQARIADGSVGEITTKYVGTDLAAHE